MAAASELVALQLLSSTLADAVSLGEMWLLTTGPEAASSQ